MKKRCIFLLILAVSLCFLCGCMRYEEPIYSVMSQDKEGNEWYVDYGEKTIRYNGITYSYTVENAGTENPTVTIQYPNGATYYSSDSTSGWSADYDNTLYASGETLVKLIRGSYTGRRVRPGAINYIFSLFFIAGGVVSVVFPRMMWDLEHMFKAWQYENPEPSDDGLAMTRLGGVIEIIIGVIIFFSKWQ